MRRYYAGIGSRKTPVNVLELMTGLAEWLEHHEYVLRSGGADGADSAFERGVRESDNKEIYLPWCGFNGNQSPLYPPSGDAYRMASEYHPAWNRCGPAARKFHARNCHQILGSWLIHPVDFVLCWTPGGRDAGGTGQALRIARAHDIPVINLFNPDYECELEQVVFRHSPLTQL